LVVEGVFRESSVSINNDDKFSERVSNEHKAKKNLRTKRKKNFQEEAVHLGKRNIKLMEERLMKKSQADEEEDYMFLMSLSPTIKNWTTFRDWNSE
jgi:hypothetical protein